MDERLLNYYRQELDYLKEEGAYFAKAHPALATHLKLNQEQVEDPFVGRILESFAFLTSRIRYQFDHGLHNISEALLANLFPHYLTPFPAASIFQFAPKAQNKTSLFIPKGTLIQGQTSQQQVCKFSTSSPVTIWPLAVTQAQLTPCGQVTPKKNKKSIHSVLTIKLETTTQDLTLADLEIDSLNFYLDSAPQIRPLLYELLLQQVDHILIAHPDSPQKSIELSPSLLQPRGFKPHESMLPLTQKSFEGYRLLMEYFHFPEKFMYVQMQGLKEILDGQHADKVLIHFFLKKDYLSLQKDIDSSCFKLNTTPVINLFPQEGEPIILDHQKSEYPIIPDAYRRSEEIEVYDIQSIDISSEKYQHKLTLLPFFGQRYQDQDKKHIIYWHHHRKACWQMGEHHLKGTESFVSFSDPHAETLDDEHLILTPKLLCSNRELPCLLTYQQQDSTFTFAKEAYEAIEALYPISPITAPTYWQTHHTSEINLLSQLCLNQIVFEEEGKTLHKIQAVLKIFEHTTHFQNVNLITHILQATTKRITKRHPCPTKQGFCSGIELTLSISPESISKVNWLLFGTIFQQFLSLSCPINSFIQLVIKNQEKGALYTWPVSTGNQPLL